jgi:predicted PurR-regulated permease PerM
MGLTRRIEIRASANGHDPNGRSRAVQKNYLLPGLALLAFLYFARSVWLPIFMACFIGMALKPVVRWLARLHIPTPVGAGLILMAFLAGSGGIFYHVSRPVVQWVNRAPAAAMDLKHKAEKVLHIPVQAEATPQPGKPPAAPSPSLQMPDYQAASTVLAWAGATIAGVVETIVLVYLALVSGNWFTSKLTALLAPRYDGHWVAESLHELQHQISHYLFSITLINVLFGLIMGGGLALLGLPNGAMWGVMAAILNYIPYFGPFVGMIVVGVASFLTFDTFLRQILPFALYLGMHLLESDVITPIFLGQRFTVHPVIIFISLIFWTWLWGVPGAFMAVPLLVATKVLCERLPNLSGLCELFDR